MMRRFPQFATTVGAVAILLLAGCASSPPERFYSLSTGMGAPGARPAAAPANYFIEVSAVTVPKQVARHQLVVTTGEGRMDLLEQERWTSQPDAEIGQALSQVVSGTLGVVDAFRTATPEGATIYRISTNVQRFESAPGRYALIDAVWSVRKVGGKDTLTCRTVANETVGSGYDALVAGHRRAVARLGADIATAVTALAAGGSASCQS